MATKVHMEALSPTMEEGQIVQWLKAEGDEVSNGDVLAEIETDKATMELVARGAGVLRKILKQEGATAPVGEVIAVIGEADEDISELTGEGGEAATEDAPSDEDADEGEKEDEREKEDEGEKEDEKRRGKEKAEDDDEGDAEREEDEDPDGKKEPEQEVGPDPEVEALKEAQATGKAADEDEDGETGDGERIKASPVARRLAREEGVELADLKGSGPGGRIVKKDVEEAAKEGARRPAAAAARPDAESDYEDVPLSQMRKTIAKRLVESIGPVPHFFLTIDVDMTRAVEARQRVNASLERDGVKVSYNDIILKATAMALRRHPECNAHWGGDHVRRFNRVHLAVAVAIDEGLITPVVRDAHLKGLAEIAVEVRELAGRAREKKLKPDEYTGGTFSVSNLGMFGIEEFTAVINPPEAGILAVGGMEERPVVVDGELEIQTRMKITMSCDHRVIDGAQGSRFLQTLKGILEEPLLAMV
jgi:pyruvate dehydrogenase E2 component (dihydrolipoamide acetyltransferase)